MEGVGGNFYGAVGVSGFGVGGGEFAEHEMGADELGAELGDAFVLT